MNPEIYFHPHFMSIRQDFATYFSRKFTSKSQVRYTNAWGYDRKVPLIASISDVTWYMSANVQCKKYISNIPHLSSILFMPSETVYLRKNIYIDN